MFVDTTSRIFIIDNPGAGLNRVPIFSADRKSIVHILGGYTKKKTKYQYVPVDSPKKSPIFYNIYDMRDFITPRRELVTINEFLNTLKSRVTFLTGNTILSNKTSKPVFSINSYPIIVTFKLKTGLKYNIETPEKPKEASPNPFILPDNMVYVYKQIQTYVVSADIDNATIVDCKYIHDGDNDIEFSEVDRDAIIGEQTSYRQLSLSNLDAAIKSKFPMITSLTLPETNS